MSYVANTEWLYEVGAGNIPGVRSVTPAGFAPEVGNDWEAVNAIGAVIYWPATQQVVSAVSTSTQDGVGGTGARKILLSGLDQNWDEQTDELVMTGTAPVVSGLSWMRVNGAVVTEVGTYHGANVGPITVTYDTDGEISVLVGATVGRSQSAHYSTPRNTLAQVAQYHSYIASSKEAGIRGLITERADSVSASSTAVERVGYANLAKQGHFAFANKAPRTSVGPADFEMQAIMDSPADNVSAGFTLVIRDQ